MLAMYAVKTKNRRGLFLFHLALVNVTINVNAKPAGCIHKSHMEKKKMNYIYICYKVSSEVLTILKIFLGKAQTEQLSVLFGSLK